MAVVKEKFNEIRVVRIGQKLFEQIKKLAKENKRTLGAQMEYMAEKFIEQQKS